MSAEQWPHQAFVRHQAERLRSSPQGAGVYIELVEVEGIAPDHWKHEAATLPEWFIKTCNAYALKALWDEKAGKFTVLLA